MQFDILEAGAGGNIEKSVDDEVESFFGTEPGEVAEFSRRLGRLGVGGAGLGDSGEMIFLHAEGGAMEFLGGNGQQFACRLCGLWRWRHRPRAAAPARSQQEEHDRRQQ